ncbi:MAG: hypothetical protein VB948_03955 [Pseudomonadales bacterium]
MKKLAIVLGVIAIIGVAGYQYRLQLLMTSTNPPRRWLYNLREDPSEQNNLALAMSGRVEVLRALLDEHNAAQAEPAWPN